MSTIIEIEEAQKRRRQKRDEMLKAERTQRRIRKERERKARPKMSAGKKLVAAVVVVLAIAMFGTSGYRNIELEIELAETDRLYEERLAEKARLEKQLAAVDDAEFVEQMARDRFRMLKDGEILYVFPEEGEDNSQ